MTVVHRKSIAAADTERLAKLIACLKSQFELWAGTAERTASEFGKEKYWFAAHQNLRALQEIGLGHALICKCGICELDREEAAAKVGGA